MIGTPWRRSRWFSSPHNFDPGVRVDAHPVELHDITVRGASDGRQYVVVAGGDALHAFYLQ